MHLLIGPLVLAAFTSQAGRPQPETIMDTRPLRDAVHAFDGVVGLYARDLLSGAEIAIDADTRFPTASAIKTAVMLEAYHQAAERPGLLDTVLTAREADKVGGSGVLKGMTAGVGLTIRDLVHLMIVLSDNTATNLLVDRLGARQVNERLDGLGLRHTRIFRATFRDGKADVHPELEREYGLGMSTPREMATLMALIAEGRAVNGEGSAAMLATLRAQQDRAMIPRSLPAGLEVGNKSGTDSEKLRDAQGRRGAIRTDAAVVTGPGVKYVIAIFVRRAADERGGVDNPGVLLGARLSRLVFDLFAPAREPR